jgi:hypothetical protein
VPHAELSKDPAVLEPFIGLELEGSLASGFKLADLKPLLEDALKVFTAPRSTDTGPTEGATRGKQPLKVRMEPGFDYLAGRDAVCIKADYSVDARGRARWFTENTTPAVRVEEAKRILEAILPVLKPRMSADPSLNALQINVGWGNAQALRQIPARTLINVAKVTLLAEFLIDFLHHPVRLRTREAAERDRIEGRGDAGPKSFSTSRRVPHAKQAGCYRQQTEGGHELVGRFAFKILQRQLHADGPTHVSYQHLPVSSWTDRIPAALRHF